ncbi:MAG: hypothetical protein JO253_04630 [Alphaproteobacteria bacterium]|nr:hypothetical protein [Alphaproteobacteria bacterium]
MQCKDIPDLPILQFLADLDASDEWPTSWGTWHVYEYEGQPSPPNSVTRAMPDKEATPSKLVQAKMRGLIERGLVDGCTCGCRGDYELTEKGIAMLAAGGKS